MVWFTSLFELLGRGDIWSVGTTIWYCTVYGTDLTVGRLSGQLGGYSVGFAPSICNRGVSFIIDSHQMLTMLELALFLFIFLFNIWIYNTLGPGCRGAAPRGIR